MGCLVVSSEFIRNVSSSYFEDFSVFSIIDDEVVPGPMKYADAHIMRIHMYFTLSLHK